MSPHNLATTPVRTRDGFKVLEVNTRKATLFGIPWRALGSSGKRKFENLLVITHSQDRIKVLYV